MYMMYVDKLALGHSSWFLQIKVDANQTAKGAVVMVLNIGYWLIQISQIESKLSQYDVLVFHRKVSDANLYLFQVTPSRPM